MLKKLLSVFFIFAALAYYDKAVRSAEEYSVFLGAFYFSSWYAFALFVIIIYSFDTRNKVIKLMLWLLTPAVGISLYQNLVSYHETFEVFRLNVNNPIVDYIKWSYVFIIALISLVWLGLEYRSKYL